LEVNDTRYLESTLVLKEFKQDTWGRIVWWVALPIFYSLHTGIIALIWEPI